MDKFLELEDVTLPEKSGVLKHKFALQSAMVNKSLQEDDATLTERSGGVLNNTNSLYN